MVDNDNVSHIGGHLLLRELKVAPHWSQAAMVTWPCKSCVPVLSEASEHEHVHWCLAAAVGRGNTDTRQKWELSSPVTQQ